ncbi:MAG: SAM-dependent methyltransferase, partial [Methyloceanibacter sp.]
SQANITDRLIALARANHSVLRLKGGDPCMFGRGGEEALALAAAGIPFRIVPGVTSGLAALTVASIPATLRGVNQALILVTGHCGDEEDTIDWAALVRTGQRSSFIWVCAISAASRPPSWTRASIPMSLSR